MDIGNNSKTTTYGKYFGTDGFRGETNLTLTPSHAYKIGRFLGWYYSKDKIADKKARIIVGRDTRLSGFMLEQALSAGMTASGADVYLIGTTTTACLSYTCLNEKFTCGVMITASHNPYYDNGIKIINSCGEKLDEEITALIEAYLDNQTDILGVTSDSDIPFATRSKIGKAIEYSIAGTNYLFQLQNTVTSHFNGLKIGLDCANGSAYAYAEELFSRLGAQTFVIGNQPNGININESCGSTHLEQLRNTVIQNNLNVGFAFDGDADRCIAIDDSGNIINGDKILYILANRFKRCNILYGETVAITVMSNLGLTKALAKKGIKTSITQVGDKFVYQRMKENNYRLGGEESGHIIMTPYSVTGDGLLTALILTSEMVDNQTNLSDLCREIEMYPSISVNFMVNDKNAAVNNSDIINHISVYAKELGDRGRIIFRASGTEELVRLTVEACDQELCNQYIGKISELLKKGGHLYYESNYKQ